MQLYWTMQTSSVAQILMSELKQNLQNKRGFVLSQVHLQSEKNITMSAQSWFVVNFLSFPLQKQSKIFLTCKCLDDKQKTFLLLLQYFDKCVKVIDRWLCLSSLIQHLQPSISLVQRMPSQVGLTLHLQRSAPLVLLYHSAHSLLLTTLPHTSRLFSVKYKTCDRVSFTQLQAHKRHLIIIFPLTNLN